MVKWSGKVERGMNYKRHMKYFEDIGSVLYLDHGLGFTGVYNCQNSDLYNLNGFILLCVNYLLKNNSQ